MWDLDEAEPRLLTFRAHDGGLSAMALSADGSRLVTGGEDHTVRLWDLRRGTPEAVVLGGHDDTVTALVFSSDDRWLASGSADEPCASGTWIWMS